MGRIRASYRRRVCAVAIGVLLATSGVVVGAAPPSYATSPTNDSIANARAITGIPTQIVQRTRAASSSVTDGDECVGGDSVWYRFQPATTITGRIITLGSNYDTNLTVFSGPRASRTTVACSDDEIGDASAIEVQFVAGVTYWIAVSACCGPEGVGGRSVLTLYRPRPPSMSFTIGAAQTSTVPGRILATGTLRCATPSVAGMSVSISQKVGTMVARGGGFATAPLCNSVTRPWAVEVNSETAVHLREGPASVTVLSHGSYDGFSFSEENQQTANVTIGSNPDPTPEG